MQQETNELVRHSETLNGALYNWKIAAGTLRLRLIFSRFFALTLLKHTLG